jgi:hypothetical protein
MYSLDTLVPNLEPYPDTLYYATPAWNFIKGDGFSMSLNNYEVKQVTPPLYSLYLIPFFALFQDVRAFYIANMVLLLGSIILFLKTSQHLFKTKWSPLITLVSGIFLVTNFYIFTLPTLLLAENITVFLSALSVYLLVIPYKKNLLFLSAVLGSLFWFIKLSNLLFGISFSILYILKLWKEKKKDVLIRYILLSFFSFALFIVYIYFSSFLKDHKNLASGASFGVSYFIPNWSLYVQNLLGGDTRSLWFHEKLISPFITILIIIGILVSIVVKKWRYLSLQLLFFVFSTVLFLSFFYAQDARYILGVFPALLLFIGILLSVLFENVPSKISLAIVSIVLGMYVLIPAFGYKDEALLISMKKQIGLNFKHREVPWNYIAVQEWNTFFGGKRNEKSYLGTVLPIYYVNLFSNQSYTYLPLVVGQDFFPGKGELGDQMNIHSIEDHYRKLLKKGARLYVTRYYINNLSSWEKEYTQLQEAFTFTEVHTGCLGSCSIYQLGLKE